MIRSLSWLSVLLLGLSLSLAVAEPMPGAATVADVPPVVPIRADVVPEPPEHPLTPEASPQPRQGAAEPRLVEPAASAGLEPLVEPQAEGPLADPNPVQKHEPGPEAEQPSTAPGTDTETDQTMATEVPEADPTGPEGAPGPRPVAEVEPRTDFVAALKGLLSGQSALPAGLKLYRKAALTRLYQANGYGPLWRAEAIASFSQALDGLVLDGLLADAYRLEPILFYLEDAALQPEDAAEWALVDLSLSEALLRLLHNLEYGKVDPEQLDADYNYPKARRSDNRDSQLLAWIKQGQIDQALAAARPQHEQYWLLREALVEHYRHIGSQGWQHIPAGRALKLGMKNARVPLLRQRLDLGLAAEQDETRYDEALEQAVRDFQEERNLNIDGIVGPVTLAAMNITIGQRIDQIRINLERQRWFDPLAEEEYLLIDVAGFKLRWVRQGETIWQERVQVGKSATRTPIFSDRMEHLIFNPTWSVPPGINRRTILPSLKIDPGYLDKKGYQLLDEQGKRIDPHAVDWKSLDRMPYIVRQPPGPNNALGRVKFMFPNTHHVFLHDTNHRELFSREVRTTSSGCVRLRDPFELAERLLGRQGWDRARIDRVLASGSTLQANLEQPLPIFIRYLTAEAANGRVNFRNDIYSRDAKLLARLDGPYQEHLADMPKQRQARIRAQLRSASKADHLPTDPEVIGVPPVERGSVPSSSWKASFIDL
ncbi:L,D-transpeptidase family protein [Magnetovirga frankeli]|uniref:L,D-transpeptidase family protein n=1 Tax=Magnetovirga frankeli TaxID=947516 RepID=UPI00129340E8|nr:L,D-transpeptidase family protein [gamma proteobacterium SS-5]